MAGRIKVELVGVFPTIFTTMCKVACNPAGVAGLSTAMEQLREYPREVVEDMEKASAIFLELSNYPGVEVRAVQGTSFRGLWLSLKHGLKRGLWSIVDGRIILDAKSGNLEGLISEVRTIVRQRRAEVRAYENLNQFQASAC